MKKLYFFPLLLILFLTACKPDDEPIDTTIPVTDLSVTPSVVVMDVGDSFSYTVTVTPNDATDQTLVCATTDSGVATCNDNGRIYANGVGTAVVTFKSVNNVTTRIDVTVLDPSYTPVDSLGPVTLTHDDSVGALSSFYLQVGLLTEDELDVIDTFLMDVSIINSVGLTIYEETIEVEHFDFFEFPGNHWYANIRIWTFDIDYGEVPDGIMFVRIYKENKYNFNADPIIIEDGLPIETTITVDSDLSQEFNTYNDATNILSKGRIAINDVQVYEFAGTINVDIELTLSGSKTFDFNNDDTYDCVWNIILKDTDGAIIDTISFTVSDLNPEDTFTGETIRFTDVLPGEYHIVVEDANIPTPE